MTEETRHVPQERIIDSELRLIPYYRNDTVSLPWYQDPEVCKQVDDRDEPYTPELLHSMYDYLSTHGACYYIEYHGTLVGDVSLRDNAEISIVVCREYQNQHIGRRCVMEMLKLAGESGMESVRANVYSFNHQSQHMFLSAGFQQTDREWYEYKLHSEGDRSLHSPFTIVRARAEDAASLLEYLKIIGGETDNLSFGPEGVPLSIEEEQAYLLRQADSADHAQYLAKSGAEIIGTASLNRRQGRMRHRGVLGISLKKSHWGCGAASALMEAILAFAAENGFAQLELEVRSDNARAIHLYEKYGFRKLCTFPAFFRINGQDVDFDLMCLRLEH